MFRLTCTHSLLTKLDSNTQPTINYHISFTTHVQENPVFPLRVLDRFDRWKTVAEDVTGVVEKLLIF